MGGEARVVAGVLLIILGGFLIGGAYSLRQQKANKVVTILTLVAALLAIAAGVLWSI
jgi:drug/metabolite transporter (DMT)-like permease